MSRVHTLKIWPVYFHAVVRGDKTFEIRKNDRDFQTGDTLLMEEWDSSLVYKNPPWPSSDLPRPTPTKPDHDGYTGQNVRVDIKYLLYGPAFGLEEGFVAMAFDAPETFYDGNRDQPASEIHKDF